MPPRVQTVLEACRSVKVKGLFLWFAERHDHPWFGRLDLEHPWSWQAPDRGRRSAGQQISDRCAGYTRCPSSLPRASQPPRSGSATRC
ncbi:type IV toxin-antitoxin system AbiEi family antitoxin domain-containing protein [Sinorhizobium psoraleae]|uniref:type IV toxin-antitoxin system AbiEi family antitoxin domain-containing protein n=1 Tax=Sinorhizobium psoraleae TaxID=520838 RepID=UPI0035E3E475